MGFEAHNFKPFQTISNHFKQSLFPCFFHILWLSQGWISPGLARRSRPGASLWACEPLGFSGSGPCGAVTSGGQQRRLRPALRQATGSVGSKWLKWGEVWFGVSYPLVMTNIAIENDHRNSGFTHWKLWFPIVMLVYQRVYKAVR